MVRINERPKILKTPEKHLPVGEPVKHSDGSIWIRLKGKGQVYEEVSLSWIDKTAERQLN